MKSQNVTLASIVVVGLLCFSGLLCLALAKPPTSVQAAPAATTILVPQPERRARQFVTRNPVTGFDNVWVETFTDGTADFVYPDGSRETLEHALSPKLPPATTDAAVAAHDAMDDPLVELPFPHPALAGSVEPVKPAGDAMTRRAKEIDDALKAGGEAELKIFREIRDVTLYLNAGSEAYATEQASLKKMGFAGIEWLGKAINAQAPPGLTREQLDWIRKQPWVESIVPNWPQMTTAKKIGQQTLVKPVTVFKMVSVAEPRARHKPEQVPAPPARAFLLASAPAKPKEKARPAENEQAKQERQLLEKINAERKSFGLPAYVVDKSLVETARNHCYWMAKNARLVHVRRPVAESILVTKGQGPEITLKAWLASPDNGENLLNPRYSRTGISVWEAHDKQLYWCAQFR